MPVIALAGIWLLVWRGIWRWLAVLPLVLAFGGWSLAARPQLLIASDGGLVGLMGGQGRALSVAKGGGFVAQNWLQGDGDLADQQSAAARQGFDGPPSARRFQIAGWRGIALRGKTAAALMQSACAEADLVILPAAIPPPAAPPQGCVLIGRKMLDATGALALTLHPDYLQITPSRFGARIWMSPRPALRDLRIAKPQRSIAANEPD